MDVRFEGQQNLSDHGLTKDRYVIDEGESGQNLRPLLLRQDGPPFTLEPSDRGVAVEGNYKDVSLRLSGPEIADVADMKKVKTAVGKDDGLALGFFGGDDQAEFRERLELVQFIQRWIL